MRQTTRKDGISVRAYAGTTGVILAMNVAPEQKKGLLGFAIERIDGRSGKKEWLTGMLPFPHMQIRPGQLIPSNRAPIQKFRWSDYRVFADTDYEYIVHPVYGTPEKLKVEAGLSVRVKTASSLNGDHCILFNRAAAASQAFSRKFPQVEADLEAARKAKKPRPPLPPEALAWLSRGVLEQILRFIDRATNETWAIDIAIYEYELPEIIQAVEAAHTRGVNVRVVYHAKPDDEQTELNAKNLAGLPDEVKRARVTHNICHHKFIVLSRMEFGKRSCQAVLCGSTNFTENGVYRQANVVHIVNRSDIAQTYLDLFEGLFRGDNPTTTRRYINQKNPIDSGNPLFAGFSPRTGKKDLQAFVDLVKSADRDVLFCTAFDLFDPLEQAFLGEPNDPVLRYGLQNSRSKISGFHADRTAEFTAAAMLDAGLEGFLKESTQGQKGNILIHTKLIIIDFTSDHPTIISGSHNFSSNASQGNDENFLIVQDNVDVADCYGCELMRLYDHYRFRFRLRDLEEEGKEIKPPMLTPDDRWTTDYFTAGTLKMTDRLRFAGEKS
jgi:phosphatidylserine/phosphatidylglycerophosphate/cardiolipin synthase-like enzyme